MVYRDNIPQPNDFISKSQRQMQSNFQDTFDIWGRSQEEDQNVGDHVPLNNPDEEKRGKHKKTSLIDQNPIPTFAANEAVLYSAKQNSQSELFYGRNLDATGNQLTSNGALSVGGLVLRAYALFDFQGKVIQKEGLDDEGNPILIDCSFNIASIVQSAPLESKWTINFTNTLETDNYMWITQSFNNLTNSLPYPALGNAQPAKGATYGSSITAASFIFMNAGVPIVGSAVTQPGLGIGLRMLFQAYTVAQ